MSPSELQSLLGRLAPALADLDEDWVIIGSASLVIRGLPISDCPDVDILTTIKGAEALEQSWAPWRCEDYSPAAGTAFRSRFSRYEMAGRAFEVIGDLTLRTGEEWGPVTVNDVETHVFGDCLLRIPSADEQMRILQMFGRPKDLRRAGLLENWRRAKEFGRSWAVKAMSTPSAGLPAG
jgi:hypothetical protein